jgi:hypothetical protein
LKRELDRLNHAIKVCADVRIPEPQCAEPSSAQDRIAHRVVIDLSVIVGMLTAIDLYDQAALEADEIKVEAQHRRLATEVKPGGAHHSKLEPQLRFLWGQVFPQLTGAFRCGSRLPHPGRFAACPSP